MKKIIKIFICLLLIASTFSCNKPDNTVKTYNGSVMLYSTIEEKYLMAIKTEFEKEYPGVTMDYYFSTAERVSHRLDVEASTYQLEADVIWAGTVLDAEKYKKNGYLEKYISNESKKIPRNMKDKEGYYVAARTTSLGIAYKEEGPKRFKDLTNEKYKDKVVMTDPNYASAYKFFVACMMQNKKYGESYFQKIKVNGLRLVDSANEVFKSVENGDGDVGIAIDYIASSYINDDTPIRFKYPSSDMVVMSTPICLTKNSYNQENGKLLIDFILSYRCQKMLSDLGLMSARKDVKNDFQTEKYIGRAKQIDVNDLIDNYDTYIEKFNDIMRG